ncbi:hypothetical protein [Singulisphaera sp. PoT]|uniref:hypothetical protein n=1 Tax=Singulisphaera sp. PoT TaxID=3411797 RepID=UPI003BF5E436
MNSRLRRGLEVLSLLPVALLLLAAVAPSSSLGFGSNRRADSFLPPSWYEKSSADDGWYALGTDYLGRPFTGVLWDALGDTLRIALLGTALAVTGCLVLGVLQGSTRSRGLEALVSAGSLGVMAVPEAAVLITIATSWPRTAPALRVNTSMVAVLVVFAIPAGARLLAERVRALGKSGFVAASKGYGATPWHTFRVEVWPHLIEDVAWITASILPRFVAVEVGLAYLGVEYRNFEGLGRTLTKSFNNLGVETAVIQMLVTIAVIVVLAVFPQILLRLFGLDPNEGNLP